MRNEAILFAVMMMGISFADAGEDIRCGVCTLYDVVNAALGAIIFLLIVLAAIVYAAGQVMGAETRARASVWATSMIIGAVIGVIILVLVPPILETMMSAQLGGQPLNSACEGLSCGSGEGRTGAGTVATGTSGGALTSEEGGGAGGGGTESIVCVPTIGRPCPGKAGAAEEEPASPPPTIREEPIVGPEIRVPVR